MYSLLSEERKEIRLLQISPSSELDDPIVCSFRTVELDHTPPYRALSYMWGDPTITEEITINNFPCQVTVNLFVALRRLRTFRFKSPFWVDAVCINQNDLREKSQQIPLMKDIYSQAAEVIMWLGEEADDSPLALALIERWAAGADQAIKSDSQSPAPDMIGCIKDPFDEKGWVALEAFFGRPYWNRQWVVQEVVCARTARVICGKDRITLRSLRGFSLGSDAIVSALDEDHPTVTDENRWKVLKCSPPTVIDDDLTRDSSDLLDVVNKVNHFQVTDTRDKIYSVLGICGQEEQLIQPDYTLSVERVFIDTTISHIRRKNSLRSIAFGGIGARSPYIAEKLDMPSWVPDFRRRSFENKFGRDEFEATADAVPKYQISSDSRILQAAGILCDRVADIDHFSGQDDSPNRPLQAGRFECCASFMNERYFQDHPARVPWRQALFRTAIHDSSGYGTGMPGFRAENHETLFFRKAAGFMIYMGEEVIKSPRLLNQESKSSSSVNMTTELEMPDDGQSESSEPLEEGSSDEDTEFQNFKEIVDSDTVEHCVKLFLFWTMSHDSYPRLSAREAVLELFCGPVEDPNRLHWPDQLLDGSDQGYLQLFLNDLQITAQKSVFITERGYIGTGPKVVQESDIICLLLGCPVPLIIRREDDHYLIIGWAYIYGMMNGEMMNELREGRLHLEDFIFH
jgi:hypothetical protein